MLYRNTKEMNDSIYSKGTFMVRVHKKNVLPQNHSQDITLNDH